MSDVLICTNWNVETSVCDSVSIAQDIYLISTSENEMIDLILNGGFSEEAFSIGFTGILALWAVGLSIGIIVAQIRRLKP